MGEKRAKPINQNVSLLMGYIIGSIGKDYKPIAVDDTNGKMIVEVPHTGNQYCVRVQQVRGKAKVHNG